MSALVIAGLRAATGGRELLSGVDLVVRSGEVHAVMGPNGAGKSTLGKVLMGHPDYVVTAGSVRLDDVDLLSLPTWERAALGLFFAPQDPVEVPGVPLAAVLGESRWAMASAMVGTLLASSIASEAALLDVASPMLAHGLNVDASGGEKKRLEALQLALLAPRIAVLDEIDSGLDVDALRVLSKKIERAVRDGTARYPLGVLAITHYRRLLEELRPDAVHVLVRGQIVRSGGPELADELEQSGYGAYTEEADAARSDP